MTELNQNKNKKGIHINLPLNIFEQIRTLTKKGDHTFEDIVEIALNEYLINNDYIETKN